MKKVFRNLPFFPLLLFVLLIFHQWFLPGVVTGGDLPYYFPQFMRETVSLSSWGMQNMGMGSSLLPTLWLQLYSTATLKILSFLPWDIYLRIVWLFPYLIFATLSSYFLVRHYFRDKFFNLFVPFLYVGNTYALLLVGGGQMGIALSFAIAPFGILAFENFLTKLTLKSSALFGVVFSLIFLLDIRIAYVLLVALGIRFLFEIHTLNKKSLKKLLFLIPLSGVIVLGLHAFWLLPTILSHGSAIKQFGDIYTSRGAVTFFSFAKFEDALGLLHPNWPENLFGLTHFMRPEFLILPLLAFCSLLFVGEEKEEKKQRQYILYFALVGLVGIFLAKGANDPFGTLYLWLFDHVPGFIMFRDPTKWYLLIALSYCVLIPFTVKKIYAFLAEKKFLSKFRVFNLQNIFIFAIVVYLLFLIRPAILGQLKGTFVKHSVPSEYAKLANFLSSTNNFSRTLWVPTVQRFGFTSYTHPAVSGEDFFQVASVSGVLSLLQEKTAEQKLQEAGVRYVIVPADSEGEIFLNDRKYDNASYLTTVEKVQSIVWLTEIPGFEKVHVFAVQNPKNHFWLTGAGNTSYTYVNPAEYVVRVSGVTKGEKLVFSETYDPFWSVKIDNLQVQKSAAYHDMLNSFVLPKDGVYSFHVVYLLQTWVITGLWISAITALIIAAILFLFK